MSDLQAQLMEMGAKAKHAAQNLALASAAQKTSALQAIADKILEDCPKILQANARDLNRAELKRVAPAILDRLKLDESRVQAIAQSVSEISQIKDPVGEIMCAWSRPNGLKIERVRTPLGVIGVIYESRPNVTADASALCLRSGNAVILRGGSDAFFSSQAIYTALKGGLLASNFDPDIVQFVMSVERDAVGAMLAGLGGAIDVIIPRGGRELVGRVEREARVPVFAHLEGLCHIYVDSSANLPLARRVVINSKLRRPAICGAVETLLIDRNKAEQLMEALLPALMEQGCEIRATGEICARYPAAKVADDNDWAREYLDTILSVKLVDGVEEAIHHIRRYSSNHTEAVIAEDPAVVAAFFAQLDSAILLHNASTQFADGGEFGFGAEIGIATGKMHARGPIGVEQLTTFHYLVHGEGQIRP